MRKTDLKYQISTSDFKDIGSQCYLKRNSKMYP